MQKQQKKNWIIQVYSFSLNEKIIRKQGYYRVFIKPTFKINEYFNPKSANYYIEIAAPFSHSLTNLTPSAILKNYEKIAFKTHVLVKDFYQKNNDEERYNLFFDK